MIGAGLSGLYLAYQLLKQDKQVIVLEARDRSGGRMLSAPVHDHADAYVDLGPAWVWPQLQPRLFRLLKELEINVFKQYTHGDILFQQYDGTVQRYSNQSAHAESYRIAGGAQRLTDTLVDKLQANTPLRMHFNTRVTAIDMQARKVFAVQNNAQLEFSADRVISALPLRLLADSIDIQPELDAQVIDAWRAIPTWMAAHCKLLFIYDAPFWREAGLSGEVFSQRGPLSEIYDGTPYSEISEAPVYALTSFVGLNAVQRQAITGQQLIDAGLAQLITLFGVQAGQANTIISKDWSREALTTTEADLQGIHQHPHYDEALPRQFFDGYLSIAGTETAVQYGGYIEGALESAEAVLSMYKSPLQSTL